MAINKVTHKQIFQVLNSFKDLKSLHQDHKQTLVTYLCLYTYDQHARQTIASGGSYAGYVNSRRTEVIGWCKLNSDQVSNLDNATDIIIALANYQPSYYPN